MPSPARHRDGLEHAVHRHERSGRCGVATACGRGVGRWRGGFPSARHGKRSGQTDVRRARLAGGHGAYGSQRPCRGYRWRIGGQLQRARSSGAPPRGGGLRWRAGIHSLRNDEQYFRAVGEVADTAPPFLMLQDWDSRGYGVPVPTLVKLFETVEAVRAVKVEVVPAANLGCWPPPTDGCTCPAFGPSCK